MSTSPARTRESPATHRPERYRASLPRASALGAPIIQQFTIEVNAARDILRHVQPDSVGFCTRSDKLALRAELFTYAGPPA